MSELKLKATLQWAQRCFMEWRWESADKL